MKTKQKDIGKEVMSPLFSVTPVLYLFERQKETFYIISPFW